MLYRGLWSMILVCVFLPGVGHAQHKHIHGGYGHGPRVAPEWSYPNLSGGPFIAYAGPPPFSGFGYPGYGYPGFGYPGYYWPGYFGYSGRAGSSWSNGLSLYGPPVPTYAPLPGVFGNDDLVRQWKAVVAPGFAGYNIIGIYSPYPRARRPTVAVWPVVESITTAPVAPIEPAKQGGCLFLSVKLPQPAAEVLVDGVKTVQTGTDRIFESPPLEAGRTYKYTLTARWVERGEVLEVTRIVTGTPGEVVRVDFTAPVVTTGK
ncbi:MAG: TIGR03000 domain-containing protein [Planctomycetia bacterium]|nr:TIGR03000 domain-containing protein [Planctomycetia bacterium]